MEELQRQHAAGIQVDAESHLDLAKERLREHLNAKFELHLFNVKQQLDFIVDVFYPVADEEFLQLLDDYALRLEMLIPQKQILLKNVDILWRNGLAQGFMVDVFKDEYGEYEAIRREALEMMLGLPFPDDVDVSIVDETYAIAELMIRVSHAPVDVVIERLYRTGGEDLDLLLLASWPIGQDRKPLQHVLYSVFLHKVMLLIDPESHKKIMRPDHGVYFHMAFVDSSGRVNQLIVMECIASYVSDKPDPDAVAHFIVWFRTQFGVYNKAMFSNQHKLRYWGVLRRISRRLPRLENIMAELSGDPVEYASLFP
jgi:hypothetical protein